MTSLDLSLFTAPMVPDQQARPLEAGGRDGSGLLGLAGAARMGSKFTAKPRQRFRTAMREMGSVLRLP